MVISLETNLAKWERKTNVGFLSEGKVMRSDLGFYVGRTSLDKPYDRWSEYFNTYKEAQLWLENYNDEMWGQQ